MPKVENDDVAVLRLWGRCKSLKTLPLAGGILDQPEYLMEAFEVIEAARQSVVVRREEAEQGALLKKKLEAATGG